MDDSVAHSGGLVAPEDLSFLWLEITALCNLECAHCYADAGPKQPRFGSMGLLDWSALLDEAAKLGCRQVQFIGGEPTLHPDLPALIRFASDRGYEFIEVFTNLTVVNEELLDLFTAGKVHIATSFYSDNPATHDAITKRSGSFFRTVAGIQRIRSAGLPLRVGIIETPNNLGHAEKARRLLESLGVMHISCDRERSVGRGRRLRSTSDDPKAELCGQCSNGKLCVTASGDIFPCVFARFAPVGTNHVGIGNVLRGKALGDFRRSLRQFIVEKSVSSAEEECIPTCSPPPHFCAPLNRCMPGAAKKTTIRSSYPL